MTLNDKLSWRLEDPAPELDLRFIEPISSRAEALISRSTSPVLRTDFVRYFGVVSILSGLDYHFTNYMRVLEQLQGFHGSAYRAVRHEAIAWLNRLGQLHYFCQWVRSSVPRVTIATPRIDALLPFRNKHAAHRSIDAPRREDTEHLQFAQALQLSDLGGSLWRLRSGVPSGSELNPSHATHFAALQIQLPDAKHQNLVIELEHAQVASEGYSVLEQLLA